MASSSLVRNNCLSSVNSSMFHFRLFAARVPLITAFAALIASFLVLTTGSSINRVGETSSVLSVMCENGRFDDVASASVVSDLVFEGRVEAIISGSDASHVTAVFRVRTLFKGSLQQSSPQSQSQPDSVSPLSTTVYRPVAVVFTSSRLPKLKNSVSNCDQPASRHFSKPVVGSKYLVFAAGKLGTIAYNSTSDSGSQGLVTRRRRPIDRYQMTRLPEVATESARKVVQQYSQRGYAKKPKASLQQVNSTSDDGNYGRNDATISVTERHRLQIHCRVSGRPQPEVTWYKDGFVIDVDKSNRRMQLRTTKRGSRLRIGAASPLDSGYYHCQARNVVGVSRSASLQVAVQPAVSNKSHALLCDEHSYCLNGGTCYQQTSLAIQFCVCQNGFHGPRCEEKITPILQSLLDSDHSAQSQNAAAAAGVLPLCSLVVSAVSLSAVISFIFYMFVKFHDFKRKLLESYYHDNFRSTFNRRTEMETSAKTYKKMQPNER